MRTSRTEAKHVSAAAERVQRWNADLPRTPSDVLDALVSIGDALRSEVEIPQALRMWMRELGRAEVEAAIAPLVDDARSWATSPRDTSARPTLQQREQAESVRRAVIRIALQGQWSLPTLTALTTLGEALARCTASDSSAQVTRAESALMDAHADEALAPKQATQATQDAVPDDDIVLAYANRGALARYVEGVAAVNADFREELAACIDALVHAEETVSDAARAWRRNVAITSIHDGASQSRVAVAADQESRMIDAITAKASKPVVNLASARRARRNTLLATLSLAAAIVFGVVGFSQYASMKESARLETEKQKELSAKQAELDKLLTELKEREEAVRRAEAEAANAKSEAERSIAMARLAAAQEQQKATQASVERRATKAGGGAQKTGNPRAACTCSAGDPLCSCL